MIIESYPANRRAALELGRDTRNLSDPISFSRRVYSMVWMLHALLIILFLSLKNRTKEFKVFLSMLRNLERNVFLGLPSFAPEISQSIGRWERRLCMLQPIDNVGLSWVIVTSRRETNGSNLHGNRQRRRKENPLF